MSSNKAVVVGIDLGACESYVAYVGKGIVDIVQNEVSKRATPSMVGFTDRERLLGDPALSLIRSNAKNSCRNFKHLIGRKLEAPDVEVEHFWSTCKLAECADGHAGYEIMYKGETRLMSAVEVTAMFLTKLRDVTEKWCDGKVNDVVIAVPSSFSDVQRQAVIDAATIANIKVLRIMNEHTATALAYGIYRSNDFDAEKPCVVAFCSMGNSLFSVSIVEFVRGKLNVICERNGKVGGRALDECLMRAFAAQFQKKHGCDPLSNKKAAYKLEDAVGKTKKVLSANMEAPVSVECLMEDEDFSSVMNREDLEKMCEPAMVEARKVLEAALAASGLTVEQIDSVEIVGGGSRVPWVRNLCNEVFVDKPLSTTMNQEESVARGCALQAAMLSPLYKVRDFKVDDKSPYAINIGWMGQAPAPAGADKPEDGETNMMEVEGEYKTSTVFPAGSPMNVLKTLTFQRKGPFDISAEFTDPSVLLPLTPKELGTWHIDLPSQAESKKIKVRARLTIHGTFQVEGAQMVEEEEYEEVVKEKRELPAKEPADAPVTAEGDVEMKTAEEEKTAEKKDADDVPMADGGEAADAVEGDKPVEAEKKAAKSPEKKAPEKKYEWVEVKKMKKRTKRTDLKITTTGRPGLPADVLQKLMDQESGMQAEMRDIVETDEKKNDLEAYILSMKSKCIETGEYAAFVSFDERTKYSSELDEAEDWLYDTYDATKAMYIEKCDELKKTGDVVAWRFREDSMRAEWVSAVTGTVTNYRAAVDQPGDKFGHIAAEKLSNIATACAELERWLLETGDRQNDVPKHEKPVLLCADMERKSQELAKMADEILREPKPKEEKKEDVPPQEDAKEQANGEANGEASPEAKAEGAPEAAVEGEPNDMDVD